MRERLPDVGDDVGRDAALPGRVVEHQTQYGSAGVTTALF
jgi:hypothetical protein